MNSAYLWCRGTVNRYVIAQRWEGAVIHFVTERYWRGRVVQVIPLCNADKISQLVSIWISNQQQLKENKRRHCIAYSRTLLEWGQRFNLLLFDCDMFTFVILKISLKKVNLFQFFSKCLKQISQKNWLRRMGVGWGIGGRNFWSGGQNFVKKCVT